jgi:hypothetical protein
VPNPSRVAELSLHARVARDVARALSDGLRFLRHVEPGTEGRLDALCEVEVEVPRLEILEHVRHVHRGSVSEVVARAEVDVAERLEVGDSPRTDPGPLRRSEPEEELGGLRDQLRDGHTRRNRHLLRQASPALETAADKPLPDARHVEHA